MIATLQSLGVRSCVAEVPDDERSTLSSERRASLILLGSKAAEGAMTLRWLEPAERHPELRQNMEAEVARARRAIAS
jgi:hypothetical protein